MYICTIIMAIIWSHERKLEVKIIELHELCRIVNDEKSMDLVFPVKCARKKVSKFNLHYLLYKVLQCYNEFLGQINCYFTRGYYFTIGRTTISGYHVTVQIWSKR
jgi:hypothetical protein